MWTLIRNCYCKFAITVLLGGGVNDRLRFLVEGLAALDGKIESKIQNKSKD